ncbi:MAG: PspA/IM30 family protein [Acidimicrobiales bacterium]
MSLMKRMSEVFQQRASAALDKAEDPAQALDLSYQKLLENLQKVRRSIAEVLTSEKRLEGQRDSLQAQFDKLGGQARQALAQNQEDLARAALTRGQTIQAQIEGLGPQIELLKTQESQLQVTGEKLAAKVAAFRSQRETLKAQYSASKSTAQAMEGVTGLSEHMADVSLMMDRAQDKISQMQARAAAVGQLADTGALDALTVSSGDDIDEKLRLGAGDSAVDAQLAALKGELGLASGQPAGALGAGGFVVRIIHDEQYRLPESAHAALNEVDQALLAAVDAGDQATYALKLTEITNLVRNLGEKLAHDDVRPSDAVVPSPDMTLAETKTLLEQPEL